MIGDSSPNADAPAVESGRKKTFWALVLEAVRGSAVDYTEGRVDRAIFLLAVPMVLEMLMESLFAVVDVFWVSRLGADAVATVAVTESLVTIVSTIAMGLSAAATAAVARRVGERDADGAGAAVGQSLLLGILVSIPIGVLGAWGARPLLALMGASPRVVDAGTSYATLMLGGNITIVLLFVLNAVFRGAGDAAVSMRVLWLANGLNIVLVPVLVFGFGPLPAMGVTGAAVATNLGRGAGVVMQLWILVRGRRRVALRPGALRPAWATLARLSRVAASGALQSLVTTSSWLALVRILAVYGSAVLAGYTIGMRLVVFFLLPAWGLANAAATMVGQSLGANQPARGVRAVYLAAAYNAIFLGIVGMGFLLGAPALVGVFARGDAAVLTAGVTYLRFTSFGLVFFGASMVLESAFNGAGDTVTPMWINFVCFWLFEIPLAWLLARVAGLGPAGIFAAVPLGYLLASVVAFVAFRRGRWQARKV